MIKAILAAILGPYGLFFIAAFLIVTALIFGFLNRCRGGFLGTGHTLLARAMYWLAPIGLAMSLIDWRAGCVCALLSYLPLVKPFSHVPFQASASLKDCLGMAAHGAFTVLCATLPVAWFHHGALLVVPVGLLAGLAHWLAYKLDGVDSGISTAGFTVPIINLQIQAGHFAVGGAEWSEAFRGAVSGIAFGLVIIKWVLVIA